MMMSLKCHMGQCEWCRFGPEDGADIPCECKCHGKPKHATGALVPDLPKGAPFRHVRSRAGMLLSGAGEEVMRTALAILINKRPDDVLGALADAIEMRERWELPNA